MGKRQQGARGHLDLLPLVVLLVFCGFFTRAHPFFFPLYRRFLSMQFDALALEKYTRSDEQRVRELNLTLERLTKEVQEKKKELDTEVGPPSIFSLSTSATTLSLWAGSHVGVHRLFVVIAQVTETQAAQIELDKTAEDFKQLHKRRQDLVAQVCPRIYFPRTHLHCRTHVLYTPMCLSPLPLTLLHVVRSESGGNAPA